MVLQLSPLFLLCLWPKWASIFLDAAAKYSVLFSDSLPPTLISQRARSIAVSTNSCVGIHPRIGSIERWESIRQKALLWRGLEVFMNVYIGSLARMRDSCI